MFEDTTIVNDQWHVNLRNITHYLAEREPLYMIQRLSFCFLSPSYHNFKEINFFFLIHLSYTLYNNLRVTAHHFFIFLTKIKQIFI